MARGRRRQHEITSRDLLVLDCLRAKQGPMTAYQLIDALRSGGLSAPPSVYRVLTRLMERDLVHRLQSLNAFVACTREPHVGVPVFTICEQCGAVTELDDPVIASELARAAEQASFAFGRAAVEVSGCCSRCAVTGEP